MCFFITSASSDDSEIESESAQNPEDKAPTESGVYGKLRGDILFCSSAAIHTPYSILSLTLVLESLVDSGSTTSLSDSSFSFSVETST